MKNNMNLIRPKNTHKTMRPRNNNDFHSSNKSFGFSKKDVNGTEWNCMDSDSRWVVMQNEGKSLSSAHGSFIRSTSIPAELRHIVPLFGKCFSRLKIGLLLCVLLGCVCVSPCIVLRIKKASEKWQNTIKTRRQTWGNFKIDEPTRPKYYVHDAREKFSQWVVRPKSFHSTTTTKTFVNEKWKMQQSTSIHSK